MAIGQPLGMTELQLQAIDGRRLTVQANAARVNTPDGPAVLALYYDITERVATEAALRRSQAMLSHLFATSPDFITLSDMETGVYVMVNVSFERMFGYAADEVVGKSALDLGIWYDAGRPREDGAGAARARRRERGRDAVRAQVGRAGHALDVGRQVLDGRARLPGGQRPRRDRIAARAAGARGDPEERLDRHCAHARPALHAGQPALREHVRLGRRRADRRSPARRCGPATRPTATIGRIAGPLLAQGPAGRGRARDDAPRRQPLLVPPAGPGGRPDAPHDGRHDLDRRRRDRAPPDRPGAGRGARRGRGRQPRQERLPRQHQPRDPHAAQRPLGPGQPGHAAGARRHAPPAVPGADSRQRAEPGGHHLRHPRPVEDRGRQVQHRGRALQPARPDEGGAPRLPVAGAGALAGADPARGRRRARHRARRPGAAAPDPEQLHHQRPQVHRPRQRADRGGAIERPRAARRRALQRERHRPGHRRGHAAPPVPALHAGRRIDHAPATAAPAWACRSARSSPR